MKECIKHNLNITILLSILFLTSFAYADTLFNEELNNTTWKVVSPTHKGSYTTLNFRDRFITTEYYEKNKLESIKTHEITTYQNFGRLHFCYESGFLLLLELIDDSLFFYPITSEDIDDGQITQMECKRMDD